MSVAVQKMIRPMVASDLSRVLSWRNHPEVRRYMYTQHAITPGEHASWFDRVSKDSSRHLLILEINSDPMGFINIHQIAAGGIADWGFYAAPDAPKGTGRQLGQEALSYAFMTADFYKLCAQSLSYNERSISFHKKLGFQQEGILRQQHFDGQYYHDVVCLGLLASEWRTNN